MPGVSFALLTRVPYLFTSGKQRPELTAAPRTKTDPHLLLVERAYIGRADFGNQRRSRSRGALAHRSVDLAV
jgi:hypothetical protein